MRWGKLRPWFALAGPLLAVVVLTAAPAGVKAGELPWPKWLVAGVVAAGGVLVAVWAPLVKARTDALAARLTRAAEREALAEGAFGRLPTVKGRVPLVKDVTDRALLDIHEAIPLPVDSLDNQGLSPELPTYVPRDIDADLRTVLEARSKTGGFVLLVGPAAAGKTRCAYEAIRAVLPHWRLFMPGDAATVNELMDGGTDLKHSVLWLNETQNFLTGADRLKSSTVRRLLADTARPTILIGTIWPTIYDQLRAPIASTDSESRDGENLNRDAYEILGLARRFSLSTWSEQEWQRAEELEPIDPRISQASRLRGNTGLTQILSAAPELIHRWEQADNPFGQAVIGAAVVARRCGHPVTVSIRLIEALAQEFLTGPQRATADGAWLAEALTWACRPVHNSGGIAPLQAVGRAIGEVDGYQVSDILVDHDSPSSPVPEQRITTSVRRRLAELAGPACCLRIGLTFSLAGLRSEAAFAWQRAADAGEPRAMTLLGTYLQEDGDNEGARTWYTRAADAAYTPGMTLLGELLYEAGDNEGARTWWQRAADAGEGPAMTSLGRLLHKDGDPEGALTWWQRAADAGEARGMTLLGAFLQQEGNHQGARTWYTRAADAGDHPAMTNLGMLLHKGGDPEGALTWWQRAAEAGEGQAMFNLGRLLHGDGDDDGARTWWQRAADAGNANAMFSLGRLLQTDGDDEGARIWYTRAADAGSTVAMNNLGVLQRIQGDDEGARTWWQRAGEAGSTDAMNNLGRLLHRSGDSEGARTWWQRAADAGSAEAQGSLLSLNSTAD